MKIQVMSDLHVKHWGAYMGVNWWSDQFPAQTQTDADVLVLAGDIVDLTPRDWRWSVARLTEFGVRYKHVIYVPGNHEYYGTSIDDVSSQLLDLELAVPGLNVLRPGLAVEFGDHRFLGGTMFQPWDDEAPHISDHHAIDDFEPEAGRHFDELYSFLKNHLRKGDIVVTHHAPSNHSIAPEYEGNPYNRWFITPEASKLILDHKPALWVHGHVHSGFDYQLGETRVLCNPMGYPGERVEFNPKLVVELP